MSVRFDRIARARSTLLSSASEGRGRAVDGDEDVQEHGAGIRSTKPQLAAKARSRCGRRRARADVGDEPAPRPRVAKLMDQRMKTMQAVLEADEVERWTTSQGTQAGKPLSLS